MTETRTTIDRQLVHKQSLAEVFITSVTAVGQNLWACQVQVPRGHVTVHGRPEEVPAILAVEIVRQAGLAVSHLGYGIPLDWAFTIQEVSAAWNPGATPHFPSHDPYEETVLVEVTDVSERKGMVSGMRMSITIGGSGTGTAVHRALAPKDYGVIRRHAPAKGAVPPRTDADVLRDMLLTETGLTASLGWNEPENPFIFDHPVDHIPGMVFADAALAAHEQLGRGAPGRGLRMVCDRFAELAIDVDVTASRRGEDTVVTFAQNDLDFAEVLVYG